MSKTSDEILRLTDAWYMLINRDHHKDCDCHWYINRVWSYGHEPYYRVEHYGYIYDEYDNDNTYATYEEAEVGLLELIKTAFRKEQDWAKTVLKGKKGEWDSWQIAQAKAALEIKL